MEGTDTKYSWLVLAVVTFIAFLDIEAIKGFSVLLPDLKEHLSSQTWIIGSCISIIYGWGYVLGLSANGLKTRFGTRFCLVFTGIISSMGLIVCSLATNELTLLLGLLMQGFIFLQQNVAIGILPEYFEKYFHIALNIVCFGSAIGIIVSPLMTQMFLDMYGWRGALLLLCGVNMQSVVCSALVKQNTSYVKRAEGRLLIPKFTTKVSKEINGKAATHQSLGSFFQKASRVYDFQMVMRIPFIARVLLPGVLYGYTWSAWLIYIISFALSKGASMEDSSIVTTWGGIGVAVIRISLPFVNQYVNYRPLMIIGSILMACSLAATTLFESVIGMSSASFVFGIGLGSMGTELLVAARDLADGDQYLNAVSWYHLAFGFGSISGGSLTGAIFDITGGFTTSFLILSVASLLIAVLLGLEAAWIRLHN